MNEDKEDEKEEIIKKFVALKDLCGVSIYSEDLSFIEERGDWEYDGSFNENHNEIGYEKLENFIIYQYLVRDGIIATP